MEKFVYNELPNEGKNHILVATIQPGTFHKAIRLTLRNERFDSTRKPVYEALSYAWGHEETLLTPVIVEHEKSDPSSNCVPLRGWLGVRSNPAAALRQLRHEKHARDIWIDALCIDQSDENLKGHQVAMMAEIFHHASRVIVWLGTATKDSNHAIRLVETLGVQVDKDWES
ncbi:heterokaryon incompatibility protein-domain-containing protein [Xylariaceae sp. FL0255]|nr:heterokaryon incompatibility protein-domain-containing protein [Xylariaceae sp. FL0255]